MSSGATDGRTGGGGGVLGGAAARFLPTALLLLALAAAFAFSGARDSFYRSRSHDWNSSKNMALAENLSPSHNFRLFLWRSPGEDGAPVYEMYSRFPVGGPALIKLAALPFGDDVSAKILAARTLALAMFAGAALFVYLALARITGCRWTALAATLFGFSSFWLLYYADEISNESVMDLFAVSLTFHGMVLFLDERRFGQLVAKSCAALLIGWHVYALLLPFIALGFGAEAVAAARGMRGVGRRRVLPKLGRALGRLALSRYLILGAAALLFGIGVLAFNFYNEYTAFDGEVPLSELPTVRSVITRVGQDDSVYGEYEFDRLAWNRFIGEQLYRVGVSVLPYAAPFARELGQTDYAPLTRPAWAAALGLAATAGAAACALFARRHKTALATLALFGFVWAIPMRHNTAFLDFESVFFAGVPMVLVAAALARARRLSLPKLNMPRAGEWVATAAALIAVGTFAASAFEMSRFGRDDARAAFDRALMDDFSEMRETVRGASVFVPTFLRRYSDFDGSELTYAASYALAGSVLVFEDEPHLRDYPADYAISRYRGDMPALITRDNQLLHLYDGARANIADLRLLGCPDNEYGTAVACDNFAVHIEADRLTYLKEGECEAQDYESRFEFSAIPQDIQDIPPKFRDLGHESLNFAFPRDDLMPGGGCMFQRKLPSYPIDSIEIGQWTTGDAPIWWREVRDVTRLSMAACPDNEYGTAIACTDFGVYLKDTVLTYIREDNCENNARGRFLLSVFPKNVADLPEEIRESGHDSLNFDFPEGGATPSGGCFFQIRIPDYPIDALHMGQWLKGPGGGGLWGREVEDVERLRFLSCDSAEYGAPVVCDRFEVYLKGDDLTYLRERCVPSDTRGRFLLNVVPANPADLPEERREFGNASLNFDFDNQSAVAGRCVMTIPLPLYPIATIQTGQWTDDGFLWEREIRDVRRLSLLACAAPEYGETAACGDFAVYLKDNALTYVKTQCAPQDTRGRFLLSVFPLNPADLPDDRREFGHASLNFDFANQSGAAGRCETTIRLPGYPIATIKTGQWTDGDGFLWEREIRDARRLNLLACEAPEYGETVACADFAVYLKDNALTYAKTPCAPTDTRGRFFLSVVPANPADLPEDRRAIGHAGLNFDFDDQSAAAGTCATTVPLPDYPIASIDTGQWIPGGGEIWRTRFYMPR